MWNAVPSMAANNSSSAVCVRFQPNVTPPSAGLTSTVRSPLSQVRRSRPVSPARYRPRSRERSGTVVPARRAMASKMSPVAERPASMPTYAGCTDPGTTPQTPGTRSGCRLIAMMQVEVPMTLTDVANPHAGANGVPVRVERAYRHGNARP